MSHPPLLDQLIALTTMLQQDQDRELSALGLTQSRTHALWILHHRGPSMQRDIADAMAVTPRHVTTLVDELVDAGLVLRREHPHDRRAVLVGLTERGISLMEQMALDHAHLDAALSAGMTAAERSALQRALEHVTTRLQAEIEAAHPSTDNLAP
ncbi:hypothetical protein ASD65_02095 [Microbacterium sp. Root61]|uniref:MarR family winged helix-turn-helix transcriptional regulator n=1 Tax=Microbacterium sp. Root61 TaxID=1736570 RepID=UPI0006F3D67F|nr:MarR family transcriptional regulator [Microbacterium sp. Root61]KRA23342.1 hypothetical protein ASD65_02095 [Microbacterium sp. Root61]